jgi:hypothetical protein
LTGTWTVSSYPVLPPVKPTIGSVASVNVVTATDCLLSEIYVPYQASVINSGFTGNGNIVDKSYVMTGLDVLASVLQPTANVESIITANPAVARSVQMASGTMTVSGTPIGGEVMTAISSTTADFAAVAATPLPGAIIAQGHSYLGAVGVEGIPEPDTQRRYTLSRIAAVLGATSESVQALTTASGTLIPPTSNGNNDCSWGAVFQKVLPPTAKGRAAYGAGAYVLSGQVNPPMPAVGQPTAVMLLGSNDASIVYGTTFTGTASTTSPANTITCTGVNYTTGGTYLPTRVGGAGVQVGDMISGVHMTNWGQVATVAFTGGNTVITFDLVGGATPLSGNGSATWTLNSGNATQFAKALQNGFTGSITRYLSGAIVRSSDAALTYGGTWTTVAQNTANTGPSIAQTVVTTSTVAYTLPANHPGGMVRLVFVGTSDLDSSGATVTLSTGGSAPQVAALTGSPVTTVGGQGWAGYAAPVVISIPTTAADAGGTITATVAGTALATFPVQFDHISFDAIYQSPAIMVTQPLGAINYDSVTFGGPYFLFPSIATAMNAVAAAFQAVPAAQGSYGGGFPAINNITPTYTNVVVCDFDAFLAKRSYYLGTSLNNTDVTTSGVTIYGYRTVAQADQVAPTIGQQLGIPNQQPGQPGENTLVTAVASTAAVTIGGNTYPAWTVTLKRNIAGGSTAEAAFTGSTSTLTGTARVFDQMWLGPDYIHPGDVGSVLLASQVLQTYSQTPGPGTSVYDNIAAQSNRWLQNRTNPAPTPLRGGVWYPRGPVTSVAPGTSALVHAIPYYTPVEITVDQMAISVAANSVASGLGLYFAILEDVSYGSYPGLVITDFGLVSASIPNGGTGSIGLGALASNVTGLSNSPLPAAFQQNIAPGHYWLAVGYNNAWSTNTVKMLGERHDDPTMWGLASAGYPTTSSGPIGWSWTPATGGGGATITSMAPAGTPTQLFNTGTITTGVVTRIMLHAMSQAYATGG